MISNEFLSISFLAYCKNPITDKWFCYDDYLVSELDPSRVCTPDAYILFYKCRDASSSSSPVTQPISESLSVQHDQIDSVVNEFNEHLNLGDSPVVENDKNSYSTFEPPVPLPRKLLTSLSSSISQNECSSAPYPLPRARTSQCQAQIVSQTIGQPIVSSITPSKLTNDFNKQTISPWSRFNNYQYCNDESERNVVYHTR